jgi:hypothetical protein
VLRQWNVQERRKQWDVFRRVELDLRQRVFKVGETLLGRQIGAAEPLAAPLSNRMKRRVL